MGCCSSTVPIIWWDDFEKSLPSLAGTTVVITGTTSGTGFVAALACVKKGAEVFLLNRDSERAEKSLKLIKERVPTGKVTQISCDLQDLASVRKAGDELNILCAKSGINVVSCNAGIASAGNKATKDGFDVQMQTNQISHFLLVKMLLPLLKLAAEQRGDARVVMHTSASRNGLPLDAKYFGKNNSQLGDDGMGGRLERYHQSKLANIVFVYALQDRLNAAGFSKIRCFAACPGAATTSLFSNSDAAFLKWIPGCIIACASQSAEDGTIPLMTCMAGQNVKAMDFVLPSQGIGGEMKGPPKTLVLPSDNGKKKVLHVEAECADPKSRDVLWKSCEEAILETFTI